MPNKNETNNYARYTLRVDKELYKKIKYIAVKEDRSINRQIEQCIKWHIIDYEKEHGKIIIQKE